ncbi:translocation/assembly module TamB domain-containing protein [Roseospirillum parvum]|uniref:Translocation and assembly module TamB n=1 Tax=Roseospirillum parvum TaxID=83401 RepID=A0A1G7XY87_9PROT|nr:translocation/assembly module TamB domain-containing protein [Roseospirillum parvum]SDG89063.1 translocation and assembly module TamB [Roseospirillum parvum]
MASPPNFLRSLEGLKKLAPLKAERRGRRLLLAGGVAVAGLAGLLVLILVLVMAGLNTRAGRDWVMDQVVAAVDDPALSSIRIGAVDGLLPIDFTLRDIALADADGPWFEADGLTLAWRPLALLGGRLHVATLAADQPRLHRLPAFAPAPPSAEPEPVDLPAGPPSPPPLTLRLDRLAIDRLELGEAVAGLALVLGAEGHLSVDGAGVLRGHLMVRRTDAPGDSLSADLALPADASRLDLDLAFSGPAGGLAARLSGLPGAPALALSLKGSGPAADWRGRLEASAEGFAALAADLSAAWAEGPEIGLDGRIVPGPELAALGPPLLANPIDLGLSAGLAGGDLLASLAVAGDGLAVDADAALAEGGGLSARLGARLADAAPLGLGDAVELRQVVLEAGLSGDPAQGAPLSVNLGAARAAGGGIGAGPLHLAFDGTLNSGGGPLLAGALDLRAQGPHGLPSLDGLLGPQTALTADLALDDAAQGLTVDNLRIGSGAVAAGGHLEVDLASLTARGRLGAAVVDLAALKGLTGLPLAGRLDADLSHLEASLEGATADLTLWGQGVRGLPAPGPALLGPTPHLTSRVSADLATGTARLEGLKLAAAGLSGHGAVTLDNGFSRVDGALGLKIPALAPLGPGLGMEMAGALGLDLMAQGPLAEPAIAANLSGQRVALAGTPLGDPRLDLSAVLGAAIEARLEARAAPRGQAVNLSSDIRFAGQKLDMNDFILEGAGSRLAGNVAADLSGPRLSGRLDGGLDMAALAPLAGRRGGGRLDLDLTLSPDNGQTAELTLAGDLALPDDGVSVNDLRLDARAASLFATPSLNAELALGPGQGPGVGWQAVRAGASGSLADLAWTLGLTDVAADGRRLASLKAGGRAELAGPPTRLVLSDLSGDLAQAALALNGPATVTLDGGETTVSGLDLGLGPARLTLDAALGDQETRADVALSGLDLAWVDRLAGLNRLAGGTLNAQAHVEPTSARASISADSVTLAEIDNSPSLGLTGEATWNGQRLSGRADLGGLGEEPLAATFALPLSGRAPALSVPGDGPLAATARWQGPLQALTALVPLPEHRMSGAVDVNLSVDGSVGQPRPSGQVTLSEFAYENLMTGTVLTNGAFTLAARAGRQFTLEGNAQDGGDGRLALTGRVDLPEGGAPAIDAKVTLDQATLIRRDEIEATVAGHVAFGGAPTDGQVTGDLTVTPVEVRLIAPPAGSPPELDVIEVNHPDRRDSAPARTAAASQDPGIGLDVRVHLPRRIMVRGRGLESEWAGDLHVTGSAAAPRVTGAINVVRGEFVLAGKRFELAKGLIEFHGGQPIDPLLDVRAEHPAGSFTGIVAVSGPASDFDLALTANPPLPQDEVLARILFGKKVSQLSQAEAIQVATAISELTDDGTGGGLDVIGGLRGALGLDRLSVGGGADGPTVEAGTYLSDSVYVGVAQGADATSSEATVEVELTDTLSVETKAGADASGEVGINWSYDY